MGERQRSELDFKARIRGSSDINRLRIFRHGVYFSVRRTTSFHPCLPDLHHSATGTRTRVARVRAEYPNQLGYSGLICVVALPVQRAVLHVSNGHDPGRTRTCNPRLRGPMPYPLGHGAAGGFDVLGCVVVVLLAAAHRPQPRAQSARTN